MKFISVVSPCYNEQENVEDLYNQVKTVFDLLQGYEYEHIFIDNASTDNTVNILKEIAQNDKNVKIVVNTRNFGHIRSPYHGLLQAKGEAIVYIASDLQDPPCLIKDFLEKWEKGYKVVLGVKSSSEESFLMFKIRSFYYDLIGKLSDSDIQLVKNSTGFGIYDKLVIDTIRGINDPYPYIRGLVCDLGFSKTTIEFRQPTRKRGITKNNFYTLYDNAMLGITNHTKIPLRLAAMSGFLLGILSLLLALAYFVIKLLFWSKIPFGIAPLMISIFFFASVQLFFIGILGEYIGAIHTRISQRPIVIEKERINF